MTRFVPRRRPGPPPRRVPERSLGQVTDALRGFLPTRGCALRLTAAVGAAQEIGSQGTASVGACAGNTTRAPYELVETRTRRRFPARPGTRRDAHRLRQGAVPGDLGDHAGVRSGMQALSGRGAIRNRHPDELSTAEAKQLLSDVRRFGPIIFVFSGGDALKRPDIVELVAHGASIGLRMAITPATTPLCTTRECCRRSEGRGTGAAGDQPGRIAPGSTTSSGRSRVRSSMGLRILRTSQEIGLSTQVNTVVATHNLDDFDGSDPDDGVGIVFWEVFFLVPMGVRSRGCRERRGVRAQSSKSCTTCRRPASRSISRRRRRRSTHGVWSCRRRWRSGEAPERHGQRRADRRRRLLDERWHWPGA
jgi:hypothetical protein